MSGWPHPPTWGLSKPLDMVSTGSPSPLYNFHIALKITPPGPGIQFTDHIKLKGEDQSVDVSVLLRRGTKILTEENIETNCKAETEGKAIQRLPHLCMHSIYIRQARTLLLMPGSLC